MLALKQCTQVNLGREEPSGRQAALLEPVEGMTGADELEAASKIALLHVSRRAMLVPYASVRDFQEDE